METGKVSNHPFAVMQFPVQRRAPLLAIYSLPTFRKPPAEVLIPAVLNEFEKLSVADHGLIDCVVLERHLVRGLLIVKSKLPRLFVAQHEEPTFNLSHPLHLR